MADGPQPAGMTDGRPRRKRNYSSWAQWQLHLDALRMEHPLPEDPSAISAWRARARGRFTDLVGPLPKAVWPELEVLDVVDCGSYRREHVVFDSEATMSVPAYMLVPSDRLAPGPAVLVLHGHGPGKSEVVGLDDPEARAAVEEHNGDYAHQLARQGYLVLAPDLRGFGERADPLLDDTRYHCDLNLVHSVMAGVSPLTANLHDLTVALDVLELHPLVDEGRIGTAGFSYGGTLALFLAAWDNRVRAAVVSGYFSSWRAAHRVPGNMCGSQVLPGMLGELEHLDVGALIAPRSLLIETGTEDPIFPRDAAEAAVADLRRVYSAMHAPADALEHDVFAGGHRWHGEGVGPFLSRWL